MDNRYDVMVVGGGLAGLVRRFSDGGFYEAFTTPGIPCGLPVSILRGKLAADEAAKNLKGIRP